MKVKFLALVGLIATSTTSCNKDDEILPDTPVDMSASPRILHFLRVLPPIAQLTG